MINGDRIRQAREVRGLMQTALAAAVGVSQSNVARWEQGLLQPSDAHVRNLALATGFPLSFFRQEAGPEFPLGSLLFRKRRALASADRDQVAQTARLAFELVQRMAASIRLYEPRLPEVVDEDPERAAELTRSALGLSPDRPIDQLVTRLEKSGVIILALPLHIDEHDAFSLWTEGEPRRPIIVLSGYKPGDRVRTTLAHELAHLVMHQRTLGSRDVERQADRFAGAFLLPEAAMRRELVPPVSLSALAELKTRWRVSMQALAVRARDLGIITDRQLSYLYTQLAAKGWRTHEPVEVPLEKPRLFRKMAEMLYGTPPDAERLAALNGTPVRIVRDLLGAHASHEDVGPRAGRTRTDAPHHRGGAQKGHARGAVITLSRARERKL